MSAVLAYTISSTASELEQLIQGCIRNERAAQEKVYKIFYPRMLSVVRRYVSSEMQAEEIMNNGFLRAFQKVRQYNFQGSFEGWLRKIIFHAVADYVKQNTTYATKTVFVEKEQYVDRDLGEKMYFDQLMKLVQELPDATRTVFNMYVMEGFTHREIGNLLGISEGTSKWHLSEGRKVFKERIEKMQLNFTG